MSSLEAAPSPSCGCRPPGSIDVEECKSVTFHECLFTRITISVGITIPNHIGLEVNYRICFGNTTCEKGLISVFGNPGIMKKNLKISSEHFRIQEDMVRMKLYVYVVANVESRLELSQLNSSPQV